MSATIVGVEVGGSALCASIPFFFFGLLTPLPLALTCADPALARVNNQYIYLQIDTSHKTSIVMGCESNGIGSQAVSILFIYTSSLIY